MDVVFGMGDGRWEMGDGRWEVGNGILESYYRRMRGLGIFLIFSLLGFEIPKDI